MDKVYKAPKRPPPQVWDPALPENECVHRWSNLKQETRWNHGDSKHPTVHVHKFMTCHNCGAVQHVYTK